MPLACAADLLRACRAIRLADYDTAELALAASVSVWPEVEHCAAYLNLLGVIHEARRDWRDARYWYRRAVAADKRYVPTQQNLRRIYELYTFGKSREPFALGDEMHDVWIARLPEPAGQPAA
ncbi:MAG: hypothetical protein JWL69_1645 [Phycisphaerales bacterium]|nr:hypothetical protein [Phycisphaerales bacterium]MDB5354631.1 hypothetical protein [Phycisphaerales bacterium]